MGERGERSHHEREENAHIMREGERLHHVSPLVPEMLHHCVSYSRPRQSRLVTH